MAEQVSSLKTGIKYKNTPTGKIPVDWEVISLRDVSEINMGQSPPSEDCNEKEEGLPFYQGNAEFGSKYPSPKKWCEKPKKIADEGDILISVRAPVGEINIAPHKCCIGRGLAAITAKSIHSQFLYHLLFLRRKYLQKISQGSTFEAINSKELSDLLIFLPAVTEQKKIAEILTTLDEAIENTDQIIEKTKEVRKGLMQRLLTCGIGHKKFKKTEIGEIPEEWKIVSLEVLFDFINGHAFYTDGYVNEGYRVIDLLNITTEGKFQLTEKDKFVSEEVYNKYPKVHLHKDDIIIIMTDITPDKKLLGKSAIVDGSGKYVLNQRVGCLRKKDVTFDLGFIRYVINSDMAHKKFVYHSLGTAQFYINTPTIKNMKVTLPPLSEQYKITEILSDVDTKIEKEEGYKAELEQLKKALMQVLLTGKIRVSV